MSASEPALDRRPGAAGAVVAVVVTAVCMVLPMWLIRDLTAHEPVEGTVAATGAAAALGAVFRAGARNLLRSTLMMAVRATSRALSRRVARAMLRSVLGLLLPTLDPRAGTARKASLPGGVAIALGFVALAASFQAVLVLADPATRAELTHGVPAVGVALLAGVPLLAHAGLMRFFAPRLGVRVTFSTTLDGLALQAYFAAASSFLPLASDAELEGPRRDKARCAAAVLIGMTGLHVVLAAVAHWTGQPLLDVLSSMFLVYAFVFAFPLQPLDGGDVWAESRWAWLVLWLVVMLLFMGRLPEAFYDVL